MKCGKEWDLSGKVWLGWDKDTLGWVEPTRVAYDRQHAWRSSVVGTVTSQSLYSGTQTPTTEQHTVEQLYAHQGSPQS